MKAHTTGKPTVTLSLQDVMRALTKLLGAFSDYGLNVVPFKGSWTAAQVADHVTRFNNSIIQVLRLEGQVVLRRPDERVAELQEIFLDFTTRLNAPDFILPCKKVYEAGALTAALEVSFARLKESAVKVDLKESIAHPAFGEITKLELMYFVVYHTQRHVHQLQHIYHIVEQKHYRFLSFMFSPPPFLF